MKKKSICALLALCLALGISGCGAETGSAASSDSGAAQTPAVQQTLSAGSEAASATAKTSSGGAIDASELFTDRDLRQTADLSEAVTVSLKSGEDVLISGEGVYVLSGTASEVTVTVEAGDSDKVQLVLDGVSVTNSDSPCIYVKKAGKVFITTTESENSLRVTGSFTADGSTKTDAVIFSKDDLVFNGLGKLTIQSTDNGIAAKDDLKITGGTLIISASSHGVEVQDSLAISGGVVNVTAGKDGLHAADDSDAADGSIYLCGGTLELTVGDDAMHAVTVIQIDDALISIQAAEGIEATRVQINGGTLTLNASDDGINAAHKSSAVSPAVEINGGTLTITMGSGDTDGIDSNGDLIITGGTISINAQSPFDYDGNLTYTGGTIIVNGEETNTVSNQFMGGGPGGMGGGPGGMGGGPGGMGGGPGGRR